MKRKTFYGFLAMIFTAAMMLTGCGASGTSVDSNSSAASGQETSETSETSAEGSSSPAEVIELNLGHSNSPENHYQAFATKFAELAAEKSNGALKVNIFPQSQLGGEVDMFQGAREGSIDMFIAGQSALTNTVKELAVFDLPFLFESVDQANEILSGELGEKYLGMLSDYNVIGLGYLSVIERNVYSSKPIETLADLKGFKIRTAQAPAYMKAYESLGAQPTPMAFSEVYLALQQGVVDGGEGSPDNYVQDKMVEVSKYYNLTKMHYLPSLVSISGATWEKLSAEQQSIIQESVKEALPESFNNYKELYSKSLDDAVAAGAQIIEPDVAEFKQAAESVYAELLADIPNGEELLKEIQSFTMK